MNIATLSPSAFGPRFRRAAGAKPPIGAAAVGYSFLRNYKVAFDYPNATLSLFQA
jgi:hypothetical protein